MNGDEDGGVFYCPMGKEYWRFSKKDGIHWRRIDYCNKGERIGVRFHD